MEKYGEILFEAESTDLKECLNRLSEEDIESCCKYKIYNRGYDYYHDCRVQQIWYNKKANTISAEVLGTREYDVEIYIENDEVHGSCDCEYYDICKHIIAVLLNIADDGVESIPESKIIQVPTIESVDYFKDYLTKLSKDELINLVMRYAPDSFIRQIQNSKSTQKDATTVIDKVEKKVHDYLNDEELLWDPSGMDAAIMKQLDKLKGFENQIHDRMGKLLIMIMKSVNEAFDEGYLYIDNYYEEDFYESADFNQYVISFIQKLSFENKLIFIRELDKTLGLMNYNTYDEIPNKYGSCFSKEESKKLAEFVENNRQSISLSFINKVYQVIESELNAESKELILSILSSTGSQEHLLLIVELLNSQNRLTDSYKFLNKFLSNQKGFVDNKIIEFYLNLAKETGSDIEKTAWIALKHNPLEKNLSLIKSYGVSETSVFEELVKDDNPVELLSFYEKEKRFGDALNLISDNNRFYDETIFSFFKKNKKILREQAEEYFLKRIDANLVSTGDSYYEKIAETVSQIKQINTNLAKEVLADLRTNYKRRTKLMGMLNRF